MKTLPLASFFLSAAAAAFALDEAPTGEQLDFFEKKIRPVLAEKCYKCHWQEAEKIKGGLMLDTREGIRRGGDNGPAVVPGNAQGEPAARGDSLREQGLRHAAEEGGRQAAGGGDRGF